VPSRDFFGFEVGASGTDSGAAATNGTTATGGRRSGFNARGFTAGDTSGTDSGRRFPLRFICPVSVNIHVFFQRVSFHNLRPLIKVG
jgi:hypothetical protein